jgi:bacillithiol biosynthesis cysteine-adding enzyme BshC
MAIDLRRWPGVRRLAADYALDYAALAPFFNGDPTNDADWTEAIRRTQAKSRQRAAIADIVANQQRRRRTPQPARDAALRLTDPRTVAVVTGQQAALFGGPLYTLLKAITAIKLAEKVERDHDVPAVAIFWIESEDHDWNEVRHATVLDEAPAPRTISLPKRPDGDIQPVAASCLDGSITAALDELAAVLPPTAFSEEVLRDLRSAYTPGLSMSEAFGRWLESLLGSRGLVVYDASDPSAKPLAQPIFEQELSPASETGRLANGAGQALAERGYHIQVQSPEDGVALFHLDAGRRPIRSQDGQLVVGDTRHDRGTLAALASQHPAVFSPNVLLRPVVQDLLFPTVCYVAGPNELAYLGQLREIYERFDIPMPIMYPRATATIADAATLRFLQKYQLPLESLQPQDDSALNQLLAAQIPPAIERAFAEAAQAIDEHMERLARAIPTLDPTLEGATRSTLGKMRHDLTSLHGKMIQAAKRRDETLRRQYTRARTLTFPSGHAQEREIAFVSFLNSYGRTLIDRLEQLLPLEPGQHWVVTI